MILFNYLAAALNPTDIMNTHPVIVMLQVDQRIKRKKKTMQAVSVTVNN